MPERPTRRPGLRRWATAAGVVLVLGGGAGAWAATRPSGPVYRLALAGPANVASVLSTTGTMKSVNQATLSFPISGQVAAVNVQVGQPVAPGQVVATLNSTDLASQVASVQARLATAQAKLASDQNAQTTATTPSAPATQQVRSAAPSRGSSSPSGGGGAPAKPVAPPPALASGQQQVREAQQRVDSDLSAASNLAGNEQSVCAQARQELNADQSSASSTTDQSPSATSSPQTSDSSSDSAVSSCSDLISAVLAAQNTTSADERALASAEASLTGTMNQAIASINQAAAAAASAARGSGSGTTSAPAKSGSTGTSGGSGSSRGTPQAPSADQIAADQSSVDAANADLAAAQQGLNAATLTSPIAGTVAAVGLTTGQSVTGASTQNDIVIVGPGTDEVVTNVTDVQIGQVQVGQHATVTPDGTNLKLPGQVTQIGLLPSSTSSGSTTYPITISLDPTSQQLFAGATADVSLTLGTAHAPVAVPTSAVRATGSRHVVSVLRNGRLTAVPVTVGVSGSTLTQIVSGLNPGDQVILANLNTPLPSTNTTGRAAFGGGGGGFGGGGGGRGGGAGGR